MTVFSTETEAWPPQRGGEATVSATEFCSARIPLPPNATPSTIRIASTHQRRVLRSRRWTNQINTTPSSDILTTSALIFQEAIPESSKGLETVSPGLFLLNGEAPAVTAVVGA